MGHVFFLSRAALVAPGTDRAQERHTGNWHQLCKELAGLGWKLQLKRRYLIQEGPGLYSLEGQCAPHNDGVLEGGGNRCQKRGGFKETGQEGRE